MIKVRKARESDTQQLEELFLLTRQKAFSWEKVDKFRREDYEKATEKETVFVAEDDASTIVGFVSVWDYDTIPFIHNLFVAPAHQRRGVGTLLIQNLSAWVAPPYQLKCITQNQIALAFYKKNGWIEIGQGVSDEGPYLLLELKKSSS